MVALSTRPKRSLMTLAQLQSFVLVARHGSVKAAAAELEVTEPAVSVAVAALRKELGDELFVRTAADRADAGRPRARGAGGRDPRPGRAGAPIGPWPRSHGGCRRRHAHGGRARRAADRRVRRARPRAGAVADRAAGRRVRRGARAPAGGHRARPSPGAAHHRRGAVPALPIHHRRRALASAGGGARDRPARWVASTGSRRPTTSTGPSSPATARAAVVDVLARRRRGGRRRGG